MKCAIVLLLAALPAMLQSAAAQGSARPDTPIRLHPAALARMIDELGGREVTLPHAKVVAMLNPQALLIESAGSLEPPPGFYDRVVVLIHRGRLHQTPSVMVGAQVRITGIARTVRGMQVSREVPWPPALTDDVVRRYEIRAAILTPAVHTTDGVPLVTADVDPVPEAGGTR